MEIPRHWRIRKQRYQLAGEICNQCGTAMFPSRAVCPSCARRTRQENQAEILIALPEPALQTEITVR